MPGSHDLDRFRTLWDEHADAVHRYLARRAPQDCEDLLSMTFAVAWNKLGSVPQGAQARWWLLKVARRQVANHWRAFRRREGLKHRLAFEPHQSFASDDPQVSAALDCLTAKDREVLYLSAWEELTAAEMAVVLGVSPAAAEKRLTRARGRFAEIFADLSGSRRQVEIDKVRGATGVAVQDSRIGGVSDDR